jgi:hypothetical protein
MTAENLAKHRSDQHIDFWRQLKEGSDRFEATREEPVVGVSFGRYVFEASRNPSREALVKARRAREEAAIAALARKKPAVMTTYVDGGQHKFFRAQAKRGTLGPVSQPDALALAGREVVIGGDAPVQPANLASAAPAGTPAKPPVQSPVKRGEAKAAVVPASAPAPAPDRPLYQRLFDVFTPSPANGAGRT